MSTELADRIRHTVEDLPVPVADPARARASGRRLRRRRTGAEVLAAAAVAVLAVGTMVTLHGGAGGRQQSGFASLGTDLDLSHGLRAYAAPPEVTVPMGGGPATSKGGEIHLGGHTFAFGELGDLDTQGTATNYGVLFFDHDDRPRLLDASGDIVTLGPKPPAMPRPESQGDNATKGQSPTAKQGGTETFSTPGRWHPSAQADSTSPLVALTQPAEHGVRLEIVDVEARKVLATRDVPCTGSACNDVVVDAMDGGVAFVRTHEGTRMWDGHDTWQLVSGPKTRIADVRNRVVLYDAATPAPHLPSGWRAVKGAIDAQLTFDGAHVLSWSSNLAATTPGAAPITLDKGPLDGDGGGAWWSVDTDGSILVAVESRHGTATTAMVANVYDCEVPSGRCTELGPLTTANGSPMFIGSDQ